MVFNKKKCSFSTDYPYGYPLNSREVLPTAGGVEGTYGFWMYPFGDGCLGYLETWWLAAF
jgi:hypothetical protein